MIKDFFTINCDNKHTVLLFFLFFFQMLGIRFFQGWGLILTLTIFMILTFLVRPSLNKWITCVFLGGIAALFQALKGSNIGYCILVLLYFIDACLMIYYTIGRKVKKDFIAALQLFLIQAFLSVVVYIIVPKSLMGVPHTLGTHNLTFLHIFYYIPDTFLGIPRLSGWAWEPGCMQMIINLYVGFKVYEGVKYKSLIIPTILLILTASTAGYIIYVFLMSIYIYKKRTHNLISFLPLVILFVVAILPLMWDNIAEKFSVNDDDVVNTSGAMRARDFLVGLEEIVKYPLLGIDMSDISNSKQYQEMEDIALFKMDNIGSMWHNYFDYAAGGYNNGLFEVHMLWGIFGIVLLIGFVSCRLWSVWCPGNFHYILPCIVLLTLVSSPLSNTPLFLFFCLYNLLIVKRKKIRKIVKQTSRIHRCEKNVLKSKYSQLYIPHVK